MSAGYQDFGRKINLAQAAASNTSGWMDMAGMAGFTLHLDYGAITGTPSLEASNDPTTNDPLTGVLPPVPISSVTFASIAGVAGTQMINVSAARARWYRFNLNSVTGTGKLVLHVHAKGDG